MLVGLQIYKRLAPGLVTPEVFERAFGLLAHLYQEQQGRRAVTGSFSRTDDHHSSARSSQNSRTSAVSSYEHNHMDWTHGSELATPRRSRLA